VKLTMTPSERVEFEALKSEVAAKTTITAERTDLMLDGLLDAQQAGRTWATRVMDDAMRDGISKMVKEKGKARDRAGYATAKGTVDLSAVSGVKRDGQWQQLKFEQMSRDELIAHLDIVESNLAALGVRKGAVARLLRIYDQHPDAPTLAAALDAADVTLDDVLGEAA
jgi:hypothetical protein